MRHGLRRAAIRRRNAQLRAVVAEAPGLADQLGAGEDRDGRALPDLGDEARDQIAAGPLVRKHRPQAPHPAAELGLALDEGDAEADVRQPDGRAQPGDAAADHQRAGSRLDADGLEGHRRPGLGDAGADEADGLAGRPHRVVAVGPGVLLADVDLGVLEGVQPGAPGDAAEGEQVQLGRARRDDQPIEALFLDLLDHVVLTTVGAREHRGLGVHHAGLVGDGVAHPGHVDVVGDVPAAMADVDADASLAHDATSIAAARGWPVFSRWAATWATAAPACVMESTMSLAPDAVPATKTPGMLV